MDGEQSSVNPWVRADLERYNPDTLALIPEGYRPEYSRIMKELAHAKAIANLILERVSRAEQERASFFDLIMNFDETGYPPNVAAYAKRLAKEPAAAEVIDLNANVIHVEFGKGNEAA